MKIEPKYYIWENTPLKWYKFLVYFSLVLGILSQFVYGINLLLSGNAHWLDLLYCFISLAWLIFSEVQLANRKWSALLPIACISFSKGSTVPCSPFYTLLTSFLLLSFYLVQSLHLFLLPYYGYILVSAALSFLLGRASRILLCQLSQIQQQKMKLRLLLRK